VCQPCASFVPKKKFRVSCAKKKEKKKEKKKKKKKKKKREIVWETGIWSNEAVLIIILLTELRTRNCLESPQPICPMGALAHSSVLEFLGGLGGAVTGSREILGSAYCVDATTSHCADTSITL
jgi:hypothetical protein